MARFHAVWAGLFVAVFLATGQYMQAAFPNLYEGDETMRMLYRSAHVYILLAAFINGALAIDLRSRRGARGWFQRVGCALVAASPVIFLLAFFVEPAPGRHDRPFVLCGVICVMLGLLLAGFSSVHDGDSSPDDATS